MPTSGVIDNIVFFGTDTHFHVKLADGTPFMVRQQNVTSAETTLKAGSKVGITIAENAARVLRD